MTDQLLTAETAVELRQAAGLNGRDMARLLGISPQYVSELQKGTRKFTEDLSNQWRAVCKLETEKGKVAK